MSLDQWKEKTAQILEDARKLNLPAAIVETLLQDVDAELEKSKPFRNVRRLEQLIEFSKVPYYFDCKAA